MPRLRDRELPFGRWNERARAPIDPERLEPGDRLLRWGVGEAAVRYCHALDDRELAGRLQPLGVDVLR